MKVDVEKRMDTNKSFGEGNIISMSFSDFIEKLENGDETLYLTSSASVNQEENDDIGVEDFMRLNYPKLLSSLLETLFNTGDFPLVPNVAGSLLPANINMWMGNSQSGSSSGLHHDFHDNIYILLRGKKKVTLYPPSESAHMKTFGKIAHVYKNGRIVYDNHSEKNFPNADGSFPIAVKQQELILKIMSLKNQGLEDEEEITSLEEELLDLNFKEISLLGEESSEFDGENSCKRSITHGSEVNGSRKRQHKSVEDYNDAEFPNSFSRIRSQSSLEQLKTRLPFLEATLTPGMMLYIPAGWFHEVRSQSNFNSTSDLNYCGHLAFNYWFYPPDVEGYTEEKHIEFLRNPYSTSYWQEAFKAQKNDLN